MMSSVTCAGHPPPPPNKKNTKKHLRRFVPLCAVACSLPLSVSVRKCQHYATNRPKCSLFFPSLYRCVQNTPRPWSHAALLYWVLLCVILHLFHIPAPGYSEQWLIGHLVLFGTVQVHLAPAATTKLYLNTVTCHQLCLLLLKLGLIMYGDRTSVQPSPFTSRCTWHVDPSKLPSGPWLSPHQLVEYQLVGMYYKPCPIVGKE